MTGASSLGLVDDWLGIEADGSVTVFSGKVELGTGVRTALAQIVAEELDVPVERVNLIMGITEVTPDEGYTAGSMTIQNGGDALRRAAAEARQALLEMATDRLDAALDELSVEDGVVFVTRRPERRISYADLMGRSRFDRPVTGQAPLKPVERYHTVGAVLPRVDLRPKVTGQQTYVTDIRGDVRHARVVPPPGPGATLVSVDESSVAALPGNAQVVVRGSLVAVLADREEQAMQAAEALRVTWQPGPTLPAQAELYDLLQRLPAQTQVVHASGQVEAALAQAQRRVRARYCQPYHAHASIGPSAAVAIPHPDGRFTVLSSTQGPYPLRGALAEMLGLPPDRIRLEHREGAGGYGQNGSDDAAAMALLLAQATRQPVRLQWSREMEFAWEPKAAAMVIEIEAGLDEAGQVLAWDYAAWSPTHTARPRRADQLLAAQWQANLPRPAPRAFGGGDRNALTSYSLPAQRVTMHWVADSPLHTSSFRALGGTANTFANECFIDELAAAAGQDPVAFRLRHLADARLRAVLEAVAELAGWSGPAHGHGAGLGVACAQYKNTGAYVATVAQVAVDAATGAVRVERLVVAHDCGLIINPDGVRNQIEGNVIQSLSRALKEEVRWDAAGVTSLDWETYPILTFSEVPDIDIILLNRSDQPPLGAGEPATVTTAPAVANAIFAACGARVRQVPFTPARVLAVLAPQDQ